MLCSKVKNLVQKSFSSSSIFFFAKLWEISTRFGVKKKWLRLEIYQLLILKFNSRCF